MAVLAVAAHSARMLAEAAARDGFEVVALDLFGDTDTRRAASSCVSIGVAPSLRIDPPRVLAALREVARRSDVIGWVAGSGFEGQPGLIEQGARLLPLIGTPADAVRRVRDPAQFFAFLAAQRIGHPHTQLTPPADRAGWLLKDALGCGAWHIRRADATAGAAPARRDACDARDAGDYYQREVEGTPMSATFIANGTRAALLGINELIVQPLAGRPFVYFGAVGPVPVAEDVARQVAAAVQWVAAEFALRGLCSLDFMLDGAQINVLEVNPRPPASMASYAALPLMRWHVRACLEGELPATCELEVARAATPDAQRVRGHRIVFARQPLELTELAVRTFDGALDVHDLPICGACFEPGDPLCSVSASAADAAQVRALLDTRARQWLSTLETSQ